MSETERTAEVMIWVGDNLSASPRDAEADAEFAPVPDPLYLDVRARTFNRDERLIVHYSGRVSRQLWADDAGQWYVMHLVLSYFTGAIAAEEERRASR